MEIQYPLAKQTINYSEIEHLIDWLKTNPKLTMGQRVQEFEVAWANYIGTKYAVFVNSGSSANLLSVYEAYKRLPTEYGIVPAVGWSTTIAPFIQLRKKLFMVDADSETYGLNLDDLERACKNNNDSPLVVIAVQVLGIPFSKEILKLKERYGFFLIEDACASLGSSYQDGSKTGTVGDISTFSFYFGHQLSTIEGGMINTNNYEIYQDLLMLRSHGWIKDLSEAKKEEIFRLYSIEPFHQPFTFFVPGFNVRGTDLQAVLGLSQMRKVDWVVSRRYENHLEYAIQLKGRVRFQDWGNDFPVSISFGALARDTKDRERIVSNLVKNGVETRLFSAGNLGLHPFWKEYTGVSFSGVIADQIHNCGFFLPNYPELEKSDIDKICRIIKDTE